MIALYPLALALLCSLFLFSQTYPASKDDLQDGWQLYQNFLNPYISDLNERMTFKYMSGNRTEGPLVTLRIHSLKGFENVKTYLKRDEIDHLILVSELREYVQSLKDEISQRKSLFPKISYLTLSRFDTELVDFFNSTNKLEGLILSTTLERSFEYQAPVPSPLFTTLREFNTLLHLDLSTIG